VRTEDGRVEQEGGGGEDGEVTCGGGGGESVLLVLLHELGVLDVLLGAVGGDLADDVAGDGEAGEEGPVAVPLAAEEHGPRVERLHLLRRKWERRMGGIDRCCSRVMVASTGSSRGPGRLGWTPRRWRIMGQQQIT
jgi:hypothetical protein